MGMDQKKIQIQIKICEELLEHRQDFTSYFGLLHVKFNLHLHLLTLGYFDA